MGATYTRQSSSGIVDGGVIEATDINNEFDQLLAAFAVSSGHTHDGTAAEGGPITKLLGTAITIGDGTSGTDIAVTFDGESADGVLTWMEDEDYFKFSDEVLMNSTEKLLFGDTGTYIHQSADGVLDLVSDTEIEINATTIDINGAVDISGALTLAGTTLAETISDTVGAMVSSNTETGITVTYEDGDNTLDFALGAAQTTITSLLATDIKIGEDDQTKIDFETADEIHFFAANVEQVYLGDNIFGPQSDSDVDLGSTGVRWKDAFIDTITTTGNVTVGGDLTVTGDDITMGTNTAGNILVADGTNFNSIAAGSLSEISTVANDDVFVAVDTSGGGLKKIARSTIVAGLATSGAISNVVEDTSPQLGGDLDTNSANILIDDAHFIADENGNEQIIFQTTGSAVNQFDITNAASGGAPLLSATGGDSNIDLEILAKGTGHVTIKGGTNSGAIQFNCESNSHGQIVIAQPHSAAVTNTLTLPAGSSSTLVSLVSTDTLTNKTLTSPKLNEDVAVTTTATELNLIDGGASTGTTAVADADGILTNDGGTMRLTTAATFKTYFTSGVSSAADDLTVGDDAVNLTTSSGNITIDAAANNTDIIFKGTDATADITMLTLDGSEAGAATFNDKVIATELDISGNMDIDGTSNLDAVDIDGAVQLDATLTIGANDQGYDVILYGDTASANVTWDTSADDLIFNGGAGLIVPDGQLTLGSTAVSSTAAELNLLDNVSGLVQADLTKLAAVDSTAAELNIVDGGTSATSTTVADADRVVLNDNGTMVQVAMTDIKTYIGGGTSWQAVKTGNFTAAAGQGVFCNTTSSAFTITLPAGSIGDEVSIIDYAGTADSNNITIAANGSEKIHGSTDDLTVATERAAFTLVFTDSTQGWLLKDK